MTKEKKQDRRKNNGGIGKGGRQKIYDDGIVQMTFKFKPIEAQKLKEHENANLLIRNLVNNYFETIKPLDTER